MIRTIPEVAYTFMIKWEGLKLKAYRCPAGVWTIGVGHTGPDVKRGLEISTDDAMELLRLDLEEAAELVCRYVKTERLLDLTDNQYAVLISFCFNMGPRPDATLWKVINRRQYGLVRFELLKWVNGVVNGTMVQIDGLVNRRTDEVVLWSTGEPGSVAVSPSSAQTREMETPPTPADASSPVKSAVVLTTGGAGLAGAPAAIKIVGETVTTAKKQLETFQGLHFTPDQLIGLGLILAIVLAGIGFVLILMKKRDARR